MNTKIEELVETLLHGGKAEAKQAKDALKKEIEKGLNPNWKSKEQRKKDRETFKKTVLQIYEKLFNEYDALKNHNKSSVLSMMSHSLFYYEDSSDYFERFLSYVREALKETSDGALRQIAVKTTSNTHAISTIDRSPGRKTSFKKYEDVALQHVTEIFDTLETIIGKDEREFPLTVEDMKPSVVKSHLLYIFDFDKFDALSYLSGMYEEDEFFSDNESYIRWKDFYTKLLTTHPHIKKFIKNVPRYDLHKHEDYYMDEYGSGEISKMVQDILECPRPEGILSADFFSGGDGEEFTLGGFSAPGDSYFEILELVGDVDNQEDLFEIFNTLYLHAWQAPVSQMYWYDLVNFVLNRHADKKLYLKILEEEIKKLSSKVDVRLPLNHDGKNVIHYGVHEVRPIFRILVEYALCHHEYGDKKVAKQYYEFLLQLNPNDNQGVRYLLAALYAGKPASYTNVLFDEGNKKQNWDKLENFLSEQNEKHYFFEAPQE